MGHNCTKENEENQIGWLDQSLILEEWGLKVNMHIGVTLLFIFTGKYFNICNNVVVQ